MVQTSALRDYAFHRTECKSFGIVEHEMGHGSGFQDYDEWTGSWPNGGSLMIVQSSSSQRTREAGASGGGPPSLALLRSFR